MIVATGLWVLVAWDVWRRIADRIVEKAMPLTPEQAHRACEDYEVKLENALNKAAIGSYGQLAIEDIECRAELESGHIFASGIIRFSAIDARDPAEFADTLEAFAYRLRMDRTLRG